MDTWGNSSRLDNLNMSLPSYETMIVESLQNVGGTRGAAPKEIFNYMIEHWPLIPNFRPSASQALARALKRGRLLKEGTIYSLNPTWTSGHTTPDSTQPARHIAKKPASIFSPRPLPPMEHVAANEGENTEASLGATQFTPETKAVAQAIVSLLHPITSDIKDLADAQRHGSTDNTGDSATDSQTTGGACDPSENVILTGFMGDSTIFSGQRHILSPVRRSSSPQDLGRPASEVILVDDSEELNREKMQQNLLRSLEGISAQLHDRYGA